MNYPKLKISNDLLSASNNVDVIYTDVWTSMGMEKENKIRLKDFKKYQINKDILNNTNKNSVFMHCLPAHVGEGDTRRIKFEEIYNLQAKQKISFIRQWL